MTAQPASSIEGSIADEQRITVLPMEWFALILIALVLGATALGDPLVDVAPFAVFFGFMFVILIVLLVAATALYWAATDRLTPVQRLRTAAAIPLAVCVVFALGSPVRDLGRQSRANHFLARNAELAASRPIIAYRNGMLGGNQYLVTDAARPRFERMTKERPVEWLDVAPGWQLVITD